MSVDIKIDAYDELCVNKNEVTTLFLEQNMDDITYRQVTYQYGKTKVVLEFPQTPQEDIAQVQKEVNEILLSELQHNMKRLSET